MGITILSRLDHHHAAGWNVTMLQVMLFLFPLTYMVQGWQGYGYDQHVGLRPFAEPVHTPGNSAFDNIFSNVDEVFRGVDAIFGKCRQVCSDTTKRECSAAEEIVETVNECHSEYQAKCYDELVPSCHTVVKPECITTIVQKQICKDRSREVCTSVTNQVCKEEPTEVCGPYQQTTKKQTCRDVDGRRECSDLDEIVETVNECHSEYQTKCHDEIVPNCHTIVEPECNAISEPKQVCEDKSREVCTSVTNRVCKEEPTEVCAPHQKKTTTQTCRDVIVPLCHQQC